MMNTTTAILEPSHSLLYRLSVFVFGVAAYVVGVGALVAVILTMLGVFRFTGGPLGALDGMGAALAVDLLLLVAFALQHSVMARPSFKAQWTRVIPAAAERSAYVLATGLVLLPLLFCWQPMPALVWSVQSPLLHWALLGIAVGGWSYLLLASFAINHFELFGLQQVYQCLRGRPVTRPPFAVRWMYRFDRHPIMTGVLVGLWVTPTMTVDHLVFAVGFTIYVWIGVHFEERSLRRELGTTYDEYCARVRSIVPTFSGRRPAATRDVPPTSTPLLKS